ncbi:hypothetical protein BU16DRAFT_538617 [Lophium mytilinum]|uniref:Uncharacterized protein n=1 Tax=Lophium mytilinum TaxID=390894 RepID=A0A6A6QV42_9PEZI|nr:hypothetical protein BU16DRAFT_538617 [Lophium mytilinum]
MVRIPFQRAVRDGPVISITKECDIINISVEFGEGPTRPSPRHKSALAKVIIRCTKCRPLQSSLRNTLATFGPESAQYQSTAKVVTDYIAQKTVSQPSTAMGKGKEKEAQGPMFTLAHRPKPAG